MSRTNFLLAGGLLCGAMLFGGVSPAFADDTVPASEPLNTTLWVQDDSTVLFPQTMVTNIDQVVPDLNGLDTAAQEYTNASGVRQCFQVDIYKDDDITAALHAVGHLYAAENPDESWPGDGTYKSEYSKVFCLDPIPPVVVEPPVVEPPVVVPEVPVADLPPALPVTGTNENGVIVGILAFLALFVTGLVLYVRASGKNHAPRAN